MADVHAREARASAAEHRPRPVVLSVDGLKTRFRTEEGTVQAVDGVSFELREAETLAIVGESGSGKTVTALSVLALLPDSAAITAGSIRFEGRELVGMAAEEMQAIRGAEIAMVFQDPLTALNPVFTIGNQLVETIRRHRSATKSEARARAVTLLERVGIPEPARRMDEYPHQLSGGMRQRVMIAMSMSCCQRILIADEPTSALDATIQAQILSLMGDLRDEVGVSILLITHDLGVVAEMADRVLVMYGGRVVESAGVHEMFADPLHPYTRGLMRSLPRVDSIGGTERLLPIPGAPPSLIHPPPGCHFHPRCRWRRQICSTDHPELREVAPEHWSACHFAETLGGRGARSGEIDSAEARTPTKPRAETRPRSGGE